MKKVLFVFLLFAGMVAFSAENNGNSRGFERGGRRGWNGGQGRGQNRGPGGRGGMMMRGQIFSEIEIAKKFPAEYAEIDKLRTEYEAKLAELAKKAEVELPVSMESNMRKVYNAYPAEFTAAVEKMKSSPREGFAELSKLAEKAGVTLFGGMRGRTPGMGGAQAAPPASGRTFSRPDLPALRKKYPEKMKEYDALRKTDPAKARQMLLQIIEADKGAGK
ncbi:MAG: hypothetical protein IJC27_03780 [Lentisphaeria bacterium]|nr:hypothetical protein [Lentisphaeria bacterium]